MKKIKKIKLTKEQKEIAKLKEEISTLNYLLGEKDRKIEELNNDASYYRGESSGYKNSMNRIDGMSIPVVEERNYLRGLLELVIVPVGREERLEKLRRERLETNYPV